MMAKMIWNYIEEDKQNFNKIKKRLLNNKKIFQCLFPRSIALLRNKV